MVRNFKTYFKLYFSFQVSPRQWFIHFIIGAVICFYHLGAQATYMEQMQRLSTGGRVCVCVCVCMHSRGTSLI